MTTIEYRGALTELCGRREEQGSFAAVADVLRHVKTAYGAKAYKEAKKMLITVDGTSILLLDKLKTRLQDGQKVSFLPICGGG